MNLIFWIRQTIQIFGGNKSITPEQHPAWRYYLRLIPQLIPVVGIGWLLFIVPTLKNNNSMIMDAFGLFPSAMILLAIVFIIGLVLTIFRIYYRIRLIRN
ncbi:hypothetical protein [Bacillus sp. 7884-1]|uniref:hypothetical protein n=1 Tax=Bacillus sp. 7884-1 TaxID=2021693 RepID=UPI0015CC38E0|nr:hypothetical protein [Bacillus sp. 7884-1]